MPAFLALEHDDSKSYNSSKENNLDDMNDFITRRLDITLSPLRATDVSIKEFSASLADYLSMLNDGGGIAFGRGEDSNSIRLGKSLENIFSTATPCIRE